VSRIEAESKVRAPGAKAWALRQLKLAVESMIRMSPDGRRAFLDPRVFPWTDRVERGWRDIRGELDAVMGSELIPFEQLSPMQRAIAGDDNWKSYWFMVGGWWVEGHCDACPETARLLGTIPGLQSAFFSVLGPGASLLPHRGPYNGVLRYHLALRIPEPADKCGLRVDGEVANWVEGQSLVFDDSFMHDAWNGTDASRVVLFLDVERPLPIGLRGLNRALLRLVSNAPFVHEIRRNLELRGRTLARA
jgi:aspartyl/asparaginyl beta-hydroxylase (cupin superfamily)